MSNIKIKRAFFAASQSGLPRDQAAHAGDFVVECDNVVNQPETAGYFVCRHWYAASLPLLTWHTIGNGVEEVLELRRVGSAGLPSGPVDAAESAGGATKMIDGLATTTGRAVPDVGVNHAETAADEESPRDTPPGAGMPSTCAEPDSPLMFGSMPILNGRPPKFTERCAYQESLAPGLRYRSMDNSPVSTRSQASPSRRQTHL